MSAIIAFIVANKLAIVSALFAISELLALSPKIAANGIFQAVFKGLKALKEKFSK